MELGILYLAHGGCREKKPTKAQNFSIWPPSLAEPSENGLALQAAHRYCLHL